MPEQINVVDLDGSVKGNIERPAAFSEAVRPEIISRAATAELTRELQPQGHYHLAGMETSAAYHGRMSSYRSGRHMGQAIRPREHLGGGRQGKVRRIPSAVKGRRAHPHLPEKRIIESINAAEYRKAIASAVAATALSDYVKCERSLPVVVSDEIQALKKTRDVVALVGKLGLKSAIADSNAHIRKGIRRSASQRHYKRTILLVVKDDDGILKAARNIRGFDVCDVSSLRANLLAPGGRPGRLTVWSESAVKALDTAIGGLSLK